MTTLPKLLFLLSGAAGSFPLAAQTIAYPSPALASPPQIAFPFYTPGAGSNLVRVQMLCPASFLAAHGASAGLVTRIGLSLAGAATYDVFVLRAGTTTVAQLGPDWAVNLPEQRVQCNFADVPLQGGGNPSTPVNQWIDFELDAPFVWQPGQSIVVDLTTRLASPGVYLQTTIGAGVARAVNSAWTPGAPATAFNGNGVAFRLGFEPFGLVPFGGGCSSPGGAFPMLSGLGDAARGSTLVLLADQVLDTSPGGFLWGFSRSGHAGTPLPLALGGGCALRVAPEVFLAAAIAPTGAGLGTAAFALPVPQDPLLAGFVCHAQWVQIDPASNAGLPLTFSNGGTMVVH